MTVRFFKIAQIELDETVDYYNAERLGLGLEFLREAFEAIERIKEFPDAWQPFHKNTRRCLLRRFPYGVIYFREGNKLLIVAIANLHREPDYWISRLG